jgi:hypothetical protein
MVTDLSLLVTLVGVPCSQTSLYRLPLWVKSYGRLQRLSTSLYRPPWQVPNKPIPHHGSILVRKMKKISIELQPKFSSRLISFKKIFVYK